MLLCALQVVASNTPAFNTVIQFVVEQEPFLVEYLDTHVLELELNRSVRGRQKCQVEATTSAAVASWRSCSQGGSIYRDQLACAFFVHSPTCTSHLHRARGWDYDPVGVARVPLRQLLDDVDIGAALGHNIAWHHIDVFGADNRRIGRVRYGFRFRKPIDALVKQYRDFERSKRPSEPDPRDPAFVAVQASRAGATPGFHAVQVSAISLVVTLTLTPLACILSLLLSRFGYRVRPCSLRPHPTSRWLWLHAATWCHQRATQCASAARMYTTASLATATHTPPSE